MSLGISRKEMVMIAVLLSGTLLAVLNQTLLSPALPAIMEDLEVSVTTVQWLTSGYSLVEAVIIPLSAYLIGRFTTRQLFFTAFVIFTAGSFTAALAPSFGFLLLGRVLQATCTGMVMPMVFTTILLVIPRENRGTAMGIIGLIIGFAPAIGPSLAGLLVDSVGWRVLFAIVTALSAIVTVIACFTLKNYGSFARMKFDVSSVCLSSIGLVCLLYGLSTFSSSDNLALTGVLIMIGLVLVGFFVQRQLHMDTPMLNVRILRTRKYAISVIAIVIVQAALMGTGVITPLYIQGVRGYSATMSGIAMLPGALIGAFMGLVAGRLFDRFGVRKVALPGVAVALLGSAGLVLLNMDTDFIFITLAYTVLTVGLQFMMTPLNTWGVNSLDNSVIQHAQGVSNTLNQVAASFGTAVLVSISTLSPVVAPHASELEQAYIGDHLAFCTTVALMVVAAAIIVLFARDKKKVSKLEGVQEKAQRATDQLNDSENGRKAIDYSAGFDGITIDLPAENAPKPLKEIQVSDAMNQKLVLVSASATMDEVIRIMAANDKSGVVVVDDGRHPVGFISDGDVAKYLGKNEIAFFDSAFNLYRYVDDTEFHKRFEDLLILNVMKVATKHVITIDSDANMDEACHTLAEKRIKMVPVLEEGRVIGTLSRRNIIHALSRYLR